MNGQMTVARALLACVLLAGAAWGSTHAGLSPEEASVDAATLQLRMRYAVMKDSAAFRTEQPLTLVAADGTEKTFPPGIWRVSASEATPARRQFHVFPKTFQPSEGREMEAYLAEWRAKGYSPLALTFGRRFTTAGKVILDNRVRWVSLARCATEAEAEALKKKLAAEQVWAWSRPETIAPGRAKLRMTDEKGAEVWRGDTPLELRCPGPVEVADVQTGFWRERRADHLYAAPLALRIGPGGELEVHGALPLETYLRGVLPAEMPASWPSAALKAQAVAARSEILAACAGKYLLEGFDFTTLETCRAYAGLGGHMPGTDRAVAETAGEVLAQAGKVATTVFSACCGGWTENNDTVWSGPPNSALRALPDYPAAKRPPQKGPEAYGLSKWIAGAPPAWCASHREYRWKKVYSAAELSALVNKKHAVGDVRSIRPGERGPGGRLRRVTIEGTKGTVTVERELAIRQAFGGLPSAMCIITVDSVNNLPKSFTFTGAGRGHGVGMCQEGARAMAAAGLAHGAILKHYFSGVELERL